MKILLVVITRLKVNEGNRDDEYIWDWNTRDDDQRAKLFNFESDRTKLLLIHGHKELDRSNLERVIEDAAKAQSMQDHDFDWSPDKVLVFVHAISSDPHIGSGEGRGKSIGQVLGKEPDGIFTYSSNDERISSGFKDAFDEGLSNTLPNQTHKRELWGKITDYCFNRTAAQMDSLLEVRELLPAFEFSMIVALRAGETQKQSALELFGNIYERIRVHLESSLLKELEGVPLDAEDNHRRLFLICNVSTKETDFNDFSWSYQDFWELFIEENFLEILPRFLDEQFDMEAFNEDLRTISESINGLIIRTAKGLKQ